MHVRCKNGHGWELQNMKWANIEKGEATKTSDISCPECKGLPVAEVKIKEAKNMGNHPKREFTKFE